jgi:flagellar motility protein MotE (MotC chaperone)
MKKAMLVMGMVVGGTALFLGACFLILKFQGRLEGEELRVLSEHPVLGAFLSAPPPAPAVDQQGGPAEGGAQQNEVLNLYGKASSSGSSDEQALSRQKVPVYLKTPNGFSTKEILEIMEKARESRARSEKEWAAIEVERANLGRLSEDLTERKTEIEKTMSQVKAAKAELEVAREEFRSEVITIEESEDRNIRKLAELYENMKDPVTAAQHFNDMPLDQAVKIIAKMDSAKVAKIFPLIEALRVKELTEKLIRFQDVKKSGSGR